MPPEDDLDGEVISINGESSVEDEAKPGAPEDRGDVVETPTGVDASEGDHQERKSAGIPKARFNEMNEKRKSAETELEAAKAEIARLTQAPKPAPASAATVEPASDFDEDAKEEAYIEAMLEGDTAKAKEIRKEINAHLRQQAAVEVETRSSQRQQADNLQAASSKAVDDFPYLDTPDGEFALGLIVAQRNADIARGIAPHIALAKAVEAIAPKFAPPDSDATPSRGLPAGKAQADTRTQGAIERGAADSLRQPASLQAGIGNRADSVRVNVQALDEDQFANLSLAEKKRLRGD